MMLKVNSFPDYLYIAKKLPFSAFLIWIWLPFLSVPLVVTVEYNYSLH